MRSSVSPHYAYWCKTDQANRYANLDAAIGMLTYQSKTIFTAIFSITLLGKRLSPLQVSCDHTRPCGV